MPELNPELLLTDALLLDAIEGLDSIASRLVEMYDQWRSTPQHGAEAALLAGVLTDLGWWSGRFEGAVSPATAADLDRLVSGGS
ncbi:MAG TPA: hypothetical protein VMZ22_03780 [Acidimicrobiales bacterium]|nr:hypothetical protein [Acidimicrobiales bacterium]